MSESIEDIIREMRAHDEPGRFVFGQEVGRLADRIEEALAREKAKNEADVMEQVLLNDAARNAIKPVFDKTEFDKSVSGPSAWDSVEDPVAEVRKMRGEQEPRHE